MWLRDFFRNDFPDCRVMTYGYDSRLQSNGVHTMLQYKKEFLAELKNARQGALVS